MVLYYGLLAFETANKAAAASERTSISKKQNSIGTMSSSSNSWIYTADLRKRYTDYRYIFIPIYINGKSSHHNYSTTTIIPQKSNGENSWMYSKSLHDYVFYSTSKISLPLITNISSSTCCVTNQAFMGDELSIKKNSKIKFFKRILSLKNKSTISLSSIFTPYTSSLSSFNTTNNLTKYRTNDVVEEEDDDESTEDENHSIPLIKHNDIIPSHATTESSNDNNTLINTTINNELPTIKSNTKRATTHTNRLTRLRSFFFKSSSSLSGT